jgi:molybdopterin-biosynthesis enzyme MoeA-like protein
MFKRFARDVPETNRQQCYFPKSARVLTNGAGTANGFTVQANGKEVWVLPGPPLEVESLWRDHVEKTLAGRIPPDQKKLLRRWRTIGKGESHLAELIEPLVRGQGVDVAYRAHAPFVELKVRFPDARADEFRGLCTDIHAALKPWLYEVDDQDLPKLLADKLFLFKSIDIYDGVTQGHLTELLGPHLRAKATLPAPVSIATSWEAHDLPAAFIEQTFELNTESEIALAVAGLDQSGLWAAGMRRFEDKIVEEHPSLYKGDAIRPRNLKAIAALAVKAWYDMLSGEGLN